MAPTTRAASKRATDPSIPSGSFSSSKSPVRKKARKSKQAATAVEAQRCMLLEVPAEVRNRIYDYCKEQVFEDCSWPSLLRQTKQPKDVPQHLQSRTFFSLTQACKQIRTEFRPLWLRQSSIRIDHGDLEDFMTTFYIESGKSEEHYRDAPRLLIISWDHDRSDYGDDCTLSCLKGLLKLRAYNPSSKITFNCRQILEYDLPYQNCITCGRYINGVVVSDDDDDSELDSMYDQSCEHESTTIYAFTVISEQYDYLEALNDFLNLSSEAWGAAIRDMDDSASVQCTIGRSCIVPTIYLRFKEGKAPWALCEGNMYETGAAYLSEMGIMNLKLWRSLDFVIGIETGKYIRPVMGVPPTVQVWNQALICGHLYKARAGRFNPRFEWFQ